MTQDSPDSPDSTDSTGAMERLTRREREVLAAFIDCETAKEVASVLCVSKRTVDFHLANAYSKLRVHGRVRAMVAAGLLTICRGPVVGGAEGEME